MKWKLLLWAVVALVTRTTNYALAQDDRFDLTFNPGSGPNGQVHDIALCPDGKILVGGGFSSFGGQPRHDIARLKSDGSLDDDFVVGEGPNEFTAVNAVERCASGGVFVGGNFSSFNGISVSMLAKLRDDGSLDLSWLGVVFDSGVGHIKSQEDGSVLVLGSFTRVNGVPRRNLARLNADGSLDTAFDPTSGVSDGAIAAFALQPDGKVIIAGSFTTNGLIGRQYVARVTQLGTLDPTFNAGYIGGGSVQTAVLQPDGKIVIAGSFSSVNGYSRIGIARLKADGSVDSTFNTLGLRGTLSFGPVVALVDGRILVGGYFDFGNNQDLARLNPDGTEDTTFQPTPSRGPMGIEAVCVQPDGRILVGGEFTSIGGANFHYLARLNGSTPGAPTPQLLNADLYPGMLLSGTVSNTYRIEWTTDLGSPNPWNPLSDVILQTNRQLIFDPVPATANGRFYRAVALP